METTAHGLISVERHDPDSPTVFVRAFDAETLRHAFPGHKPQTRTRIARTYVMEIPREECEARLKALRSDDDQARLDALAEAYPPRWPLGQRAHW